MATTAGRPYSREAARLRLYLFSLVLDLGILLLSFALANILVIGSVWGQPNKPHGLVMFAMIAPVYALLAINGGVYGIRMVHAPRESAWRALLALAQAVLLTLLIVFLGKIAENLSRLTFALGLALSFAGLLVTRYLVDRLSGRALGDLSSLTAVILDGYDFAAPNDAIVIDAAAAGIDPHRHDAGTAALLARATQGAERVIVACANSRFDAWSVALQSLAAKGEILIPDLLRFSPAKVAEYDAHPTLVVSGGPLQFRERVIKRLFDILFGTFAILLLSPVLIAAAIAVALSSRGPIFFRQQRLGRDAHPFMIVKFRTMRQDMADPGAQTLTQRDDARVTRVGAFLRRTSIDELPQLFNVLLGDMSLVGPRPHAPAARAADKLYWEVDDRYWGRHCIKPGITGLAQVRGHRGATDTHADLVNRLQSDLEYVTDWSVWRDLRILLATARVMVHENAF